VTAFSPRDRRSIDQHFPDLRRRRTRAPAECFWCATETPGPLAERSDCGVINLARGETLQGSPRTRNDFERCLEAVIAAVIAMGGFTAAARCAALFSGAACNGSIMCPRTAKTGAAEWAQARGLPTPRYA